MNAAARRQTQDRLTSHYLEVEATKKLLEISKKRKKHGPIASTVVIGTKRCQRVHTHLILPLYSARIG